MKTVLGACLLASAAIVPFSSANAVILVDAVSFNNPARLVVTDPNGVKKTVFLAPAVLSRLSGFDIFAYCIDISHDANRGKQSPFLSYSYGTFNNDFAGNAVSATMAREIGYLAQIGKTANHLDGIAIQGAIWQKMFAPQGYQFALTVADPVLTARIDYFAGLTKMSSRVPGTLVSNDGHQSWTPGVPEPASWGLMIAGFGMMGVAMRIRARRATYSYAS